MVQRSYRRKQLKRRFTRHRSLIRGGQHWTRRYLDNAGNFFSYPFKLAYNNFPFRWNKSKSAAHDNSANPVSSKETDTANSSSSLKPSKQQRNRYQWTVKRDQDNEDHSSKTSKTNQSWFTASTTPSNKSSKAQNEKTNDKSDENKGDQDEEEEEVVDSFNFSRFNPFGRKKPKQTPQDKQSNVGLNTKNEFNKTLDQAKRTETKSSTLRDATEKFQEQAKELRDKLKQKHSLLDNVPEFDVKKWFANTKKNHGGKRRRKTRRRSR